jgi:energy-converting hydrogenase Eha subunit E
MMPTDFDPGPEKGRPIQLTPVPPGVWLVILGSGVTVLGPLFGFLIGTILGTEGETLGMSPIFLGFLVAGAGLGIAILGVRRHLRSRMTTSD